MQEVVLNRATESKPRHRTLGAGSHTLACQAQNVTRDDPGVTRRHFLSARFCFLTAICMRHLLAGTCQVALEALLVSDATAKFARPKSAGAIDVVASAIGRAGRWGWKWRPTQPRRWDVGSDHTSPSRIETTRNGSCASPNRHGRTRVIRHFPSDPSDSNHCPLRHDQPQAPQFGKPIRIVDADWVGGSVASQVWVFFASCNLCHQDTFESWAHPTLYSALVHAHGHFYGCKLTPVCKKSFESGAVFANG